jgi:hypothetical protein
MGTRHRRLPQPGIPPSMREAVFKPFLPLDDARNQDGGGSGLAWRSRATLRARMAATSRLTFRRKADYRRRCACRAEQGFLSSLQITGRAGEDFHQAFCAIRVRFQPAVDARGGLTDGCKGPPPAADSFAERSQAVEDDIGEIAVLLEIGAAVLGDRVKPRGVGGRS